MPNVVTWYADLARYFRDAGQAQCELEDHNGAYLSCQSPGMESKFTVRVGSGYQNGVDDLYCHANDSGQSLQCRSVNGEFGFNIFKDDSNSLKVTHFDSFTCMSDSAHPEQNWSDGVVSLFVNFVKYLLDAARPEPTTTSCTEQ